MAPPGGTSSSCPGTGCCQKAYGGHSGRASLGSLSERLGMGRARSRKASPLRNTHTEVGCETRQQLVSCTGGRRRATVET